MTILAFFLHKSAENAKTQKMKVLNLRIGLLLRSQSKKIAPKTRISENTKFRKSKSRYVSIGPKKVSDFHLFRNVIPMRIWGFSTCFRSEPKSFSRHASGRSPFFEPFLNSKYTGNKWNKSKKRGPFRLPWDSASPNAILEFSELTLGHLRYH